jgi:RNA polymerase sigma-70 factor (ECF subfamily)
MVNDVSWNMSAPIEATEVDAAFEAAFRELFPKAFRVGFRILGNETDAEDAAAEALARAHASWKKVGGLAHRDAWILRVTANVAIDMARKNRPLPLSSGRIEFEEQTVLRMTLAKALLTLPRRQREVIALRWLADLSEADVARVLGINGGTVKKTAHRGMASLRARLGEDWQATPAIFKEASNDSTP